MKCQTGYLEPGDRYCEELKYLYKRLSTVTDLIRTLEEYDVLRPRPATVPGATKTA